MWPVLNDFSKLCFATHRNVDTGLTLDGELGIGQFDRIKAAVRLRKINALYSFFVYFYKI